MLYTTETKTERYDNRITALANYNQKLSKLQVKLRFSMQMKDETQMA